MHVLRFLKFFERIVPNCHDGVPSQDVSVANSTLLLFSLLLSISF